MSGSYLLGVDIGTYESKGVLVSLDGQTLWTEISPHNLSIPQKGWAEHDAEEIWWGEFCSIVQRLLSSSNVSSNDIIAIGCSGIGPCMLPLDSSGRPLRPAVLYGIDTRAVNEIAYLENLFGEETIFEACGAALSAQSIGPKILWEKENEPGIYQRTAKFVTSTTYLVAKLTNEYYIDHYTAASFHPLYDLHGEQWNKVLSEPIVSLDKLPKLAWTTDIAGRVTRHASEETGLAEGTPVIVGTVDAAAEAVSVGVVSPGQMMIMYGSTVFMIEVLDEPKVDRRLWSAPYLFPNTHCMMAGMATSGSLTRWFRDNLAKDLLEMEMRGESNAYSELAREAEKVSPGSEGLIVLPYFSGERTPINDPKAKGVIFGLGLSHKRGHLYRASLEGIGYGIRHHFDVLRQIGAEPKEVVAVGGGTKNPLWLQIVSDVCEAPQMVPSITIGASYGDAFLAGLGAGAFSSVKAINQWLREIRKVKPDPDTKNVYDRYFHLYLQLYKQTKQIMHAIIE